MALPDLKPVEGDVPAFKADMAGLTCMTLEAQLFNVFHPFEVPSVQSKDAWHGFLQLLSPGTELKR